ncbi:activating signal cointegrator 1 complex subunit 1-like isoform X1 [Pieris brassicae]|uniref:activating signal cointegrator 1 complex subunit 1-like isoform X1 n=1 Tax=Pieris brassicae TaxID=7116 RepID=UPI001E65FFC7|nr:activating signal cointegrator 1 complex subunit 1-like isoform X1 [Pieris brassicae]
MNDILKPELIWIESRCYRVNDPIVDVSLHQEHDLYENDMPYQDLQENDDDTDYEVQMIDSDRYCTTFHVSKHYLGNIIGKKGAIKMRIQRDTKTDIQIPRMGENKDVVIYGPSVSSVKAARRKINMIVISARIRQRYTHFISLPMNNAEIVKNFEKFKELVLQDCQGTGLDDSLFTKASKLHITVGVMCLMDTEERLLASKYLAEVKEQFMPMIQSHLPLKLRLKGLSYMNDDPKEMHVLYGCVQEDNAPKGVLQDMIDAIAQFFFKKGLMANEFGRDNVKIHVTLLNSSYREKTIENDRPTKQKRESFDGSEILEKFIDYDFGVMEVNHIHLSQINTLAPGGFYQSTCVISL